MLLIVSSMFPIDDGDDVSRLLVTKNVILSEIVVNKLIFLRWCFLRNPFCLFVMLNNSAWWEDLPVQAAVSV